VMLTCDTLGSLDAMQFPNFGAVSTSSLTGTMALHAFEKTFHRPVIASAADKDRRDLITDRSMSLHSRSPTATGAALSTKSSHLRYLKQCYLKA
jgi:hypothetical protein